MGNVQSRQRYYEAAFEATHNARMLQREVGGPRIRGAILAYIDDRISAEHMMRTCTQLEANEFQRLAETTYFRFIHRNAHLLRCQPRRGRCRYPGDNIHNGLCEYYVPLPPDIDVNDAAYIQDRAQFYGLGAAMDGCNCRLRNCPYGDMVYDSDRYSDESSDSYSDESEYSDSGYVEEIHSHGEPDLRGNSHDDDSLDRIFHRMSDMRLRGDESSRSFGRDAFNNEAFMSNERYAEIRSSHRPGRISGRSRGTTATRGGRQANTRSPPPTIGRRGATSLEGRSAGTRPNLSTGRGGANLHGGSRGGHRRATQTTRPRSPAAHDESRENLPNPSTGRGGMALGVRGGMPAYRGRGGQGGMPAYGGLGGRGGMPAFGGRGGQGGMLAYGGRAGQGGMPASGGRGGQDGMPASGGRGGQGGMPAFGGRGGQGGMPAFGGRGGQGGMPTYGGRGGSNGRPAFTLAHLGGRAFSRRGGSNGRPASSVGRGNAVARADGRGGMPAFGGRGGSRGGPRGGSIGRTAPTVGRPETAARPQQTAFASLLSSNGRGAFQGRRHREARSPAPTVLRPETATREGPEQLTHASLLTRNGRGAFWGGRRREARSSPDLLPEPSSKWSSTSPSESSTHSDGPAPGNRRSSGCSL